MDDHSMVRKVVRDGRIAYMFRFRALLACMLVFSLKPAAVCTDIKRTSVGCVQDFAQQSSPLREPCI